MVEGNFDLKRMIDSADTVSQRVGVCVQVYKMAEESDQPGEVLCQWAKHAKKSWSSEKNKGFTGEDIKSFIAMLEDDVSDGRSEPDKEQDIAVISEDDIAFYLPKCTKFVDGMVDFFSNRGLETTDYYQKLWLTLSSVMQSAQSAEKGVALYAFLRDRRTPYYTVIVGKRMSDERYKEVTKKISTQLEKLQFSFALTHSQRTELASRILSVMEEIDSNEERIVFLGHVITYAEQNRNYERNLHFEK